MSHQKKPFRFKKNQPIIWFHKVEAQSNQYCLYCSRPVAGDGINSNKEHLIGRSFVPTGSLDDGKAFNFIFRACVKCNQEKAEAERHISSVTLFNSQGRADEGVDALARRKAANDFHPIQKGKLVKNAQVENAVELKRGNLKAKLGLIGPPQLSDQYIRLLAFRHIQGFYSLIETKNPTLAEDSRLLASDHWWLGGNYPYSDWGNAKIMEMARRVETWEAPLDVDTANGFFKVRIRCSPRVNGPWFWAMEWNKSFRLFGGIFDLQNSPAEFENLPESEWIKLGSEIRMFQERSLNEHEDKLF